MVTLFISDLHLSAERSAIIDLFRRFLRERAPRSDALYILGDLFEYWIGDDAIAHTGYVPVVSGLRALTDAGVPVFVMHGNRDFLLGRDFEVASGAQLLPDPTVIDLYGESVLLMHGDTLCTDDVAYQKFRVMVRDPDWTGRFLARSLAEREGIVRGLRETSKAAMATKDAEIMDVNQRTVDSAMREHRIQHLIHGHTHRPAQHEFQLNGTRARRTVLGDWYDQGSVLVCSADGCTLEQIA